jgi:hypothetical protein
MHVLGDGFVCVAADTWSGQTTQTSSAAAQNVGNYNRNDQAKSPTGILSRYLVATVAGLKGHHRLNSPAKKPLTGEGTSLQGRSTAN